MLATAAGGYLGKQRTCRGFGSRRLPALLGRYYKLTEERGKKTGHDGIVCLLNTPNVNKTKAAIALNKGKYYSDVFSLPCVDTESVGIH